MPPTPGNHAPATVADSYATRGLLQVLVGQSVLSNGTDADGDALTASLKSTPAHGTLQFQSDGTFTYTPAVSYAGTDTFTYVARDGKSESPAATVTLTVTASPDVTPPALSLVDPGRVLPRLIPLRGSAEDVYILPGRGPVVSSGLKSVVVQLQRFGGDYWNGHSYQKAPFNLPTVRSGRSFFTVPSRVMPPLSQAPGGRYKWAAIATDNAGNITRATQFVLVDSTPPTVVIVDLAAGSNGVAQVSQLEGIIAYAALDAVKVEVTIRRGDGLFWNGHAFQTALVRLPLSRVSSKARPDVWGLSLSLPATPARYTIQVSAIDAAGNVGVAQRTVQVSSTPTG